MTKSGDSNGLGQQKARADARTIEYNAVVEKFNALAKQIEQAAAKKE